MEHFRFWMPTPNEGESGLLGFDPAFIRIPKPGLFVWTEEEILLGLNPVPNYS
jgi:hypothetical protein